MKAIEAPSPLRRIRAAMNSGNGLSAQSVANEVARLLGETSRTGESIVMIEQRGSSDWYVIHALAEVYNRSAAEIALAGAPKNKKQIVIKHLTSI